MTGEAEASITDEINAIGLKAYARIADAWSLTNEEASGLISLSAGALMDTTGPGVPERLTKDQFLRISAIIGIYRSLMTYFSAPLSNEWFTRRAIV